MDDYTATGEVSTYTENGINFLLTPKRFHPTQEVANHELGHRSEHLRPLIV